MLLAAGLLCAAMWLAFYVPVYVDEILLPMITSRGGFDSWRLVSLRPICTEVFGTPIPLSLMPGRALAWLSHSEINTPSRIRLYGIGSFFAWLCATVYGLCRYSNKTSKTPITVVAMLVACMACLGLMPFMAVLTRVETLMALAISFYTFYPFALRENKMGPVRYYAAICLFLIVTSWFFSAHPKSLIFAPLLVPSLVLIKRQRPRLGVAMIALTLLMGAQALALWIQQLSCSVSYDIVVKLNNWAVLPTALLNPFDAFMRMSAGVLSLSRYGSSLLFSDSYNTLWLPSTRMTALHDVVNVMLALTVACIFMAIPKLLLQSWTKIEKRKDCFTLEFCMPALLFICIMGIAAVETEKNFYDMTLVGLVGILCFTMQVLQARALQKYTWFFPALGALACISLSTLLYTFQMLPDVSRYALPNGELTWQYKSQSVLRYDENAQHIRQFAKQCGLDIENPGMRHLVIDMFTYFPLQTVAEPIYEFKYGVSPVQNLDASGAIGLCRNFPPEVQKISMKNENLCCATAGALKNLPGDAQYWASPQPY